MKKTNLKVFAHLAGQLLKGVKSIVILIMAVWMGTACSEQEEEETVSANETRSKVLTEAEAQDIALKFIEESNNTETLRVKLSHTRAASLELVYTEPIATRSTNGGSKQTAYYVFNVGETGYVIVSASDATYPILGYSDEGPFLPAGSRANGTQSLPQNLQTMLDGYSKEINHAWKYAKVTPATQQEREKAMTTGIVNGSRAYTQSVKPLLGNINWNQAPYYNAYCPAGTPVGCVATATCQIMRYWEYPSRGTGMHTSTHDGRIADFNHDLNWSNMPRTPLQTSNQEVARFCYDVAVGLNMMFGRDGSGTWQKYVPDLLKNHYHYASTVTHLYRQNYDAATWRNTIENELNNRRPVQYAGAGEGGAHSFVCDGHSGNGYFHINWGWGGVSNGYFLLNALDPGNLGIGGGDGGFNYYQEATIGIQPPGNSPEVNKASTDYPQSYGQNSYSTCIYSVKLGSMTCESQKGDNYADYTHRKVNATPGTYLRYELTPGYTTGYYCNNYWRVWIDFDNDGQFSQSERVVNQYSTHGISGSFAIPYNLKGEYRIRVSMKTTDGYPSPNEIFRFGEVEDYTLVV